MSILLAIFPTFSQAEFGQNSPPSAQPDEAQSVHLSEEFLLFLGDSVTVEGEVIDSLSMEAEDIGDQLSEYSNQMTEGQYHEAD